LTQIDDLKKTKITKMIAAKRNKKKKKKKNCG